MVALMCAINNLTHVQNTEEEGMTMIFVFT